MAIPYVPVVNNDSFKTPEKMFTLESVGMATDSEGFLKIEDPDLFTKTLGLRHSPESIMESGLKGFKDFDQFNRFLEKSVSDGLAFKDPSFYSNLQSEDFGLLRDYSKSTEAFKTDSSISENIDKALGLDAQKGEPSDAKVEVKDGMVFEKPGLDLDAPAPVESEGNPYLFGTEGNQSQIANLSDIGNGKVAMPNRSDRRSMADFNESVMSKEFVLNAAKRKARELESLEKARRNKVSLTEPAMERWIRANPKSRAANLALDADGNVDLSKISDAEKIQFTKNLNLGNIDFFNKPEGPKGVPVFDKDGLVGFENTKKFEEDMGGESVKVDPRTEAQKREARILDEIDQEIKETGQHPFGEDPVLGTNYRQEVRNRENYGPGYKQLKDQSLDLLDNPEVQKSIPSAPSIPMAPTTKPSMPASYNRSIVSPDMLAKNRQDVNDVLDSVPMPEMPKKSLAPVKSSPYNYTHRRTLEYPTEPSQSGLVNSTKEYPTFSLETPAEPGPELTRTTKEYPTEPTQQSLVERTLEYPVKTPEGAQQRKQTPGYGRSGKKQFNIPALDFLDLTNYTYNEPSYEQTQRPGFGRSGKKQFNLKFLDRFDPRNYSYKQ